MADGNNEGGRYLPPTNKKSSGGLTTATSDVDRWSSALSSKDVSDIVSILRVPGRNRTYTPTTMQLLCAKTANASDTAVHIVPFPVLITYNGQAIDLSHCAVVFVLSSPSDTIVMNYLSPLTLIVFNRKTERRTHYWVIDAHSSFSGASMGDGRIAYYPPTNGGVDNYTIHMEELDLDWYHQHDRRGLKRARNEIVISSATSQLRQLVENLDHRVRSQIVHQIKSIEKFKPLRTGAKSWGKKK